MKALEITRLDYLILTHPDADHIGGAPTIISTFEIGKIIMPDHAKSTAIFNRTLDAIEESGADIASVSMIVESKPYENKQFEASQQKLRKAREQG